MGLKTEQIYDAWLPIHLYDLRNNTDRDDWELGLRAACALFAENVGGPAGRYDMIAFRAYEAQRICRIRGMKK